MMRAPAWVARLSGWLGERLAGHPEDVRAGQRLRLKQQLKQVDGDVRAVSAGQPLPDDPRRYQRPDVESAWSEVCRETGRPYRRLSYREPDDAEQSNDAKD